MILLLSFLKLALEAYPDRIRVGLGCYLMNDYPDMFQQQMDILHKIKMPGIAYYEYFDIMDRKNLKGMIQNYSVRDIDVDNLYMPDVPNK